MKFFLTKGGPQTVASGRAWTGRSLEDVQDRELVLEEGEAVRWCRTAVEQTDPAL